MRPKSERLHTQLIDQCEQIVSHTKLLRDYASTPDNVWLARGELSKITGVAVEIENLLSQINIERD